VQHTCLHDRGRPDGVDRVGQALQSIADDDAHVGDAAVLDLADHREPVLCAFPAVAGPQPEDLAFAVGGDREGDVDGSVDDLPIADLDVDGVHEHHG